jgi:hypothetical protein
VNPVPPTILWWGDQLRIHFAEDSTEQVTEAATGRDDSTLAEIIAGKLQGAGNVRLIYHPAGLESHRIEPLPRHRRRCRRKLARLRPVVLPASTVWSAVAGRISGAEGILAVEPKSVLPRLVGCLRPRGIEIDGAWTIWSLLETGPAPEMPASVRAAVLGNQAIVSSVDSRGNRDFRSYSGEDMGERLLGDLRTLLAQFEETDRQSAWIAMDRECLELDLQTRLAEIVPDTLPISQLAARVWEFSRGDAADLLADQTPAIRRRRRMTAAGLLASALVAALAALHHSKTTEMRRLDEVRLEETRLRALRASDEAVRRATGEQVQALVRLNPPHYRYDDLLLALSNLPDELVVEEVSCLHADWTIAGRLVGVRSTDADALVGSRHQFLSGKPSWSLTDQTLAPSGTYRWKGILKKDEPTTPSDPSEVNGFLASVRANLPTGTDIDRLVASLPGMWHVAFLVESDPEGILRHYTLEWRHPTLRAWSSIVESVQVLASHKEVTLDEVHLQSAPGGADAFIQAMVGMSARTRG